MLRRRFLIFVALALPLGGLGCPLGGPGSQRAVLSRDWYRIAGTDLRLRVERLTGGHRGYYLYRENADGSLTETGIALLRDGEVEHQSGTDPYALYYDQGAQREPINQPDWFTADERRHRQSLNLPEDISGGE